MASFENAQDQHVEVGDTTFAYRLLGPSDGVPLVLFMHFRGTMDHWDPALVNPLAARRPVVLIDNAGVGRSQGTIPLSFVGWAQHYINVINALGLPRVDIMGFSMGGCVAQLVALNAPALVRKLVLCGTVPSTGPGVVTAPLDAFNQLRAAASGLEQRAAFLATFFSQSERSQAAGAESFARIVASRKDKSNFVDQDGARRQGIAFSKFMDPEQEADGSYNRLHELKMPVLIANGSNDLLLPTENSILMWKKLSHADAQLHLYPDSGHGFLYQYAGQFAALVNDFLDSGADRASRL